MTEIKFLLTLADTTDAYKWYLKGNKIRAKARNGKTRGEIFDPITAVARYIGRGNYGVNKRGRKAAGKASELTSTLSNSVVQATEATCNRGNKYHYSVYPFADGLTFNVNKHGFALCII